MKPIYIVGAGPGDPELLTVKANRLLAGADLVVWAGSLIHPDILSIVHSDARIVDSAKLTLEEILAVLEEGYRHGLTVIRLHTGDPSIYGAINEQIRALKERQIPVEVVPGVSSFLAAAAALGIEYTIPELTQTLIISRMEGRTPVPERESIAELAKHQSSISLFLSIQQLDKVVEDLKTVLDRTTPVAVVEKVTWPEERIIRGTLANIVSQVNQAGIEKTALIIIGKCLKPDAVSRSKLYDPQFEHGYRKDTEI